MENRMESAVIVSVAFLSFLALGFLFRRGKGKWLIAGYNTMSERERQRYDEKKLMKIMSHGMFTAAGCLTFTLAGELLGNKALVTVGFSLLALVLIVTVFLSNTRTKQ